MEGNIKMLGLSNCKHSVVICLHEEGYEKILFGVSRFKNLGLSLLSLTVTYPIEYIKYGWADLKFV